MSKDWGEGEGVKPENTEADRASEEERRAEAMAELAEAKAKSNPYIVRKRAGEKAQAFIRDSFSGLPSDFLIINDLIFSDIPATSISIQSEMDVFVAETLRTSTATVEPKGRGMGMVSVQLLFRSAPTENAKLKRLMAELLHNPFVFIENNKIRQALFSPNEDDLYYDISTNTETMAFVLHFGSLSISDKLPNVMVLDLQLAQFNYKPFSHHFWYGTRIAGFSQKDLEKIKDPFDKGGEVGDQLFPYDMGFESYDLSEKVARSIAVDALAMSLEKSSALGPLNNPVIFPHQSPAYLYYVDHLEKLMPEPAEYNCDYIRFVYPEFQILTPPANARTDSGTFADFFSESEYTTVDDKFRKYTFSGQGSGSGGGEGPKQLDMNKRVRPVETVWITKEEAKVSPKNKQRLGILRLNAIIKKCGIDDPRIRALLLVNSIEASNYGGRAAKGNKFIAKCWWHNAWGHQAGRYHDNMFKGKWTGNWYVEASVEYRVEGDPSTAYKTPNQPWRAYPSWSAAIKAAIAVYSQNRYKDAWALLQAGASADQIFAELIAHGFATSGKGASQFTSYVNSIKNTFSWAEKEEAAAAKAGRKGPLTLADEYADKELATQRTMEPWTIDAEKERNKKAQEQPNNDQQPPVAPPESVPSMALSEIPSKKAIEVTNAERETWLLAAEADGWTYYGGQGKFKNLFYRNTVVEIGGNSYETLGESNIVATAASIQFGHRLARHKLLGQDTPTWQFLGAGNKSGTIVFSAAGPEGMQSLQKLRSMYATLMNNARNVSLVRGSSSVSIVPWCPNTPEANNIFLFSKVENIVITSISDESVIQDGVDVYRMTIEFLAQDFPESSFVPRNYISLETKNAMMGQLLKDLLAKDRNSGEKVLKGSGGFLNSLITEKGRKEFAIIWKHTHLFGITLSDKAETEEQDRELTLYKYAYIWSHIIKAASSVHTIRPSKEVSAWDNKQQKYIAINGYPQWYVDLLFRLSSKIKLLSQQFPLLALPSDPPDYLSKSGSVIEQDREIVEKGPRMGDASAQPTWEVSLRKFGDNLGGAGDNLVELIGGKGNLPFTKIPIRGYYIPDTFQEASQLGHRLLDQFGMELNKFFQECMSQMKDKEGFIKVFKEAAYNEIFDSVMSDFGECYQDLNLPESAKGYKLLPEFYMYDDSMENASLTQITTGTGAMAEAIKRHIRNSARSNAKFISDSVMGAHLQLSGKESLVSASRNVDYLKRIRQEEAAFYKAEEEFLGATGGFAGMSFTDPGSSSEEERISYRTSVVEEALRTFDIVNYLLAVDEQKGDDFIKWTGVKLSDFMLPAQNEWLKFEKYGVYSSTEMTKAFLTAVVTTANYSCFKEFKASDTEKGNLYSSLRDYYYRNILYDETTGEEISNPVILRGPSVLNTAVDQSAAGNMSLDTIAEINQITADKILGSDNLAGPSNQAPDPKLLQEESCVSVSPEEAAVIEDQKMMEQELAVAPNSSNPTDEDYEMALEIAHLAGLMDAQKNYAEAVEELKEAKPFLLAMLFRGTHGSARRQSALENHAAAEKQLKNHLSKLYDMFKDVSNLDKKANALLNDVALRIKKDISLRRAYPTFKIYFIDEDSETEGLSGYKAFDDFYSYNAVQEIRITRSRKIAADLAIIRIADVSQKMSNDRFNDVEMDEEHLKKETPLGWEAETLRENPFNGAILQEGVKVQIRLGYAASPDELESVFLGQIVEIAPGADGKILEITCQGYGAELEAASMDNPEEELIYYSPQHALSAAIMQPFVQHFGHWSFNTFYNPAQIRNRFHSGGESPFEITFVQDYQREQSFREMRFKNYRNNPEDDNIFAPPPWTYADGWDRFWNNMVAFRPLMMTPWEVFKEHELRHPGYAALAVPYGHEPRMTMFFGARGQNYWCRPPSPIELAMSRYWTELIQKYGGSSSRIESMFNDEVFMKGLKKIRKDNPDFYRAFARSLSPDSKQGVGYYLGALHGRYRPFRNYHIFTSEHHILRNEIKSSMTNTFNAVEIRYATDDDTIEETDPEEIIEAIREVESGGGGTLTVQLNDNIPDYQIRTYEDSFPSCLTEAMARRYAQGLLMEGVRSSYTGDLTVTGEETLKPFDIVMVRDHINDMYGPIEVDSVTHIFSRESGFISVITPNMCVDANDWYAKGWLDTTIHVLSLVYEIAERQKNLSSFKQNPISVGGTFDNLLAKWAAFQIIHWDQTASPMCITPLMYRGRPLMSVTTAPKFAPVFSNLWGKWHQWWNDFHVGLAMGGISEELRLQKDDIANSLYDLFDASQGGARNGK